MKTRKVLRYYCDHCRRGWWSKKKCLDHEPDCWKNPDRTPKEGELYPWPRKSENQRDGAMRHHADDKMSIFVDSVWPRAYFSEGYDCYPDLTLCGWEPEDPEEPHIYLRGRWRMITNDSWRLVARWRYEYDRCQPGGYCRPGPWDTGDEGKVLDMQIANRHYPLQLGFAPLEIFLKPLKARRERSEDECQIPF